LFFKTNLRQRWHRHLSLPIHRSIFKSGETDVIKKPKPYHRSLSTESLNHNLNYMNSTSSLPHRNDGYFHTKSPMAASHNPNPILGLASNIILQYFGPTIQTVADCLIYHFPASDDTITGDPGASLSEIISCVLSVCSRSGGRAIPESLGKEGPTDHRPVSERDRILADIKRKNLLSSVRCNRSKGSEERGYIVDEPMIRAALLTLVHHSLVRVRMSRNQAFTSKVVEGTSLKTSFKYSMDTQRVLCILRYGRYVDWTRTRVFSNTSSSTIPTSSSTLGTNLVGACLIQELCIQGRMLSMELLSNCRELLESHSMSLLSQATDIDEKDDVISKTLVEVFKQLVDRGFIELVPPMTTPKEEDEQEADFSNMSGQSGQKGTFSDLHKEKDMCAKNDPILFTEKFPVLSSTLQSPKYKRYFPRGVVWRVNVEMFHAHMRAHFIGRLVHERYGDQVANAGHIVTAVLRLTAHRQHSPLVQDNAPNTYSFPFPFTPKEQRRSKMISGDANIFSPDDIMEYLSPHVINALQAKSGGARTQLSTILVTLSLVSKPSVLLEVESAQGHPKGGKFEVITRNIVGFINQHIALQMVRDHLGEIPGRIISILDSRGYTESESIAEAAMVPAKDAREVSK